ncbi:hypothetical protein NX059_002402 [Plenodomus lindquistii]|nr:hypothetical protein NX059_002402 [Plenodomus lindquistii]
MEDDLEFLREEYGEVDDLVELNDDDPLFQVFRSFHKIVSVDIYWLCEKREPCLPTPFFTSASKWRVSGCMSRELFQHLLSTPATHLTHLELDNLAQYSEIIPSLPRYRTTYGLATYWSKASNLHTVQPHDRLMSGALDSLIDRCPLLSSLAIITVGHGLAMVESSNWYEETYASWARFLGSVRSTLHYLAFKQGVNRKFDKRPEAPTFGYEGFGIGPWICCFKPTFYLCWWVRNGRR